LFEKWGERFSSVVSAGTASTTRESRDNVIEERVGTATNVVKLSNCNLTSTTNVSVSKIELNFEGSSLSLESVFAWRVKFNSCKLENKLSVGGIPPSQCANTLSYREVKIVSNSNKLQSFPREVESKRGYSSSIVGNCWDVNWRLSKARTTGSIIRTDSFPVKWAVVRPL